jgi:hypothetical protein
MIGNEDKLIAALKRVDNEQEMDTLSTVLTDMMRRQSFFLRAFPLIATLVFLGLAVFAAIRFFSAQDAQSWIGYATLFLMATLMVSQIKMWLYLVWVRNSLMREIKRMELRNLTVSNR